MQLDNSGEQIKFTALITGIEGKPFNVETATDEVLQAIKALDIEGTAGQVNATGDAVMLIGKCCRRDVETIKKAITTAVPDTTSSFDENETPTR